MPEAPVIHGSVDLSSTSMLSFSSCATQSEVEYDTDDASDGLSMIARDVQSVDSAVIVNGQRSAIFQ